MTKCAINNMADYLCAYVESETTCAIRCSRCNKEEVGQDMDEWEFAEKCATKGWRATQRDKVVCPKCDKKK